MGVSRFALVALAAAGSGGLAVAPAAAQQPAPPAARSLTLGAQERPALQALEAALRSGDRAAQDAALAAARAAARSGDGRYAVGHYQLHIARARGDAQLAAQAVDAMIASGAAPAEELPALVADQAARAYSAGEYQRAEQALARVVQLQPNNAAAVAELAQMKGAVAAALRRDTRRQAESQAAYREALALLRRAIELQRASGQPVAESWYQRAAALALEGGMGAEAVAPARALVEAYPLPGHWRDALLVYRQAAGAASNPALDLDIRRLMRAAQALSGERDYLEFAEALGRAGGVGEAKAVLDEGLSRGMLDSSEAAVRQTVAANARLLAADRAGLARARTQALAAAGTAAQARAAGDAHFGHGQYAQAAELYAAALQKGGEDADLVNTRLGAALAMAGRRSEAEAAFRAVAGPRADLAAFWLAWLARRPA